MSTAPHDPASGSQPVPLTDTVVKPKPKFGSYELHGELGRGGMGTVYRAYDPVLERDVALKVLPVDAPPELRHRFLREGRAAAKLKHPNLCPVYTAGTLDGYDFIAMELVEGPTLRAAPAYQPPVVPRAAAELVRTLAGAIGAAHARAITHRDLKPSNVVMCDTEPVVIDFGVAKHGASDQQLTRAGAVVGTPLYMAPEQARGAQSVGPPADVWSLGAMLFELVTGSVPFRGANEFDTAILTANTPAPDPRELNPELDSALAAIIARCLEKETAARFQNGTELAAALTAYLDAPAASPFALPDDATEPDAPAPARRAGRARRRLKWALAGATVVLCAVVVGLLISNRTPHVTVNKPDPIPVPSSDSIPPPVPREPFVNLAEGAGQTFRFGNYEYLIDATPIGAKTWLDAHQSAKRTVMWLDAYQVERDVRFAALATDAVHAEWNAALDLPCGAALAPNNVKQLGMDTDYEFVSVSLYNAPGLKGAFLWHRGKKPYLWQVDLPGGNLKMAADSHLKSGSAVGFVRPLDARCWAYAFVPPKSNGKSDYLSASEAREIDDFFKKLRAEHGPTCRPGVIAVGGPDKARVYGATALTDSAVTDYRYTVGATAEELKRLAAQNVRDGFVPVSLTGYYEGPGSRFCAIWVKREPKSITNLDPKHGTTFTAPGWQYLIDATPVGIEQWLKDRKSDGHSVIWLDAYLVDGKSRFAALAALDERAKSWIASTDVPYAQFNINQDRGINGLVPAQARLVSLSVYQERGEFVASLWHSGTGTFQVWPGEDGNNIKRQTDDAGAKGALIPQIRPYIRKDADKPQLRWAWYKLNPGRGCVCLSDGFEQDVNEFVTNNRTNGKRPGAIGAVSHGGRMYYAATMYPDDTVEAFDFETRIPGDVLRDKVKWFAEKGYEPASLTGYGTTDGTRFAVVWVKRKPAKK